MKNRKQFFEIKYTPSETKVDEDRVDVKENSNRNIRVTLGEPIKPEQRIRNPHEGIKIIDHSGSTKDDGGFLSKRFNR